MLYDIRLYNIIPTEVKLLIEYEPVDGQPLNVTTIVGFINTDSILYLEREPPSTVKDTEFTVRVALIASDLTTLGPLSDRSQTLGEFFLGVEELSFLFRNE